MVAALSLIVILVSLVLVAPASIAYAANTQVSREASDIVVLESTPDAKYCVYVGMGDKVYAICRYQTRDDCVDTWLNRDYYPTKPPMSTSAECRPISAHSGHP